jgi:hypothetical protein
MGTALTRTTDSKGRVSLPASFANATVVIERVSETELRIRKAYVIPEDELRFAEDSITTLSDRDRDTFLALLNDPPPPNDALKSAASKTAAAQRVSKSKSGALKSTALKKGVARNKPRRG